MEGEVLGIVLFGLAGIAWLLVPFWRVKRRSSVLPIVGVVIILYIVGMTVVGYTR